MAEVFPVWRCSDVLGELVVQKQSLREQERGAQGAVIDGEQEAARRKSSALAGFLPQDVSVL